MSYYKVKNIKRVSNDKYSLLCAASNVQPLSYKWTELLTIDDEEKDHTLCKLIHSRELHLQSPKNKIMRALTSAFDTVTQSAKTEGKGWRFHEFPKAKNHEDLNEQYAISKIEDEIIVNEMTQRFRLLVS